jgi:hypothetical protein
MGTYIYYLIGIKIPYSVFAIRPYQPEEFHYHTTKNNRLERTVTRMIYHEPFKNPNRRITASKTDVNRPNIKLKRVSENHTVP